MRSDGERGARAAHADDPDESAAPSSPASCWPPALPPAWAAASSCCPLGDRCLLQHVVDAALASRLDEVVVVLGHRAEEIRAAIALPADGRARVVVNPDFARGQSTSLRGACASADARVAGAGGSPRRSALVGAALIDRVAEAFLSAGAPPARPVYPGCRRGARASGLPGASGLARRSRTCPAIRARAGCSPRDRTGCSRFPWRATRRRRRHLGGLPSASRAAMVPGAEPPPSGRSRRTSERGRHRWRSRFKETLQVDAPIDRVWEFVNDPQRVVTCMPGAVLDEVVDERTFLGTVKVKVGAITASYKGRVEFTEVDAQARTLAGDGGRARDRRRHGQGHDRHPLERAGRGPDGVRDRGECRPHRAHHAGRSRDDPGRLAPAVQAVRGQHEGASRGAGRGGRSGGGGALPSRRPSASCRSSSGRSGRPSSRFFRRLFGAADVPA